MDDERLGLTVPAGDVDATSAALVSLARDAELRASASRRLRALAPAYRWETAVEPLVRWLEHPRRAPGRALRMASVEPPRRDDDTHLPPAPSSTLYRTRCASTCSGRSSDGYSDRPVKTRPRRVRSDPPRPIR